MAGKPSKGMDGPLLLAEVGGTKEKTPGRMLRCCFVAKYLELLIPILSSYLALAFCGRSCSAGKYLLHLSQVENSVSLPKDHIHRLFMYLGPTDFYLSCLGSFAYLDLSVLSVVMQEVYGKQRSENTTQAKAVTACATLPYTGNSLGAGEDLSLL